jgi:hypothetical protein
MAASGPAISADWPAEANTGGHQPAVAVLQRRALGAQGVEEGLLTSGIHQYSRTRGDLYLVEWFYNALVNVQECYVSLPARLAAPQESVRHLQDPSHGIKKRSPDQAAWSMVGSRALGQSGILLLRCPCPGRK